MFSIAATGKKLPVSFCVDLAIRGEIGLCCKVRPIKQVGRAASITSCTASQNESALFAACRCSNGFPIQGRQSTRQLLWIAVSFPRGLLKPQLFIASTRQIDWTRISANNDEQRKIQLKIPGEASRSGRYFNDRQLVLLRSNH